MITLPQAYREIKEAADFWERNHDSDLKLYGEALRMAADMMFEKMLEQANVKEHHRKGRRRR